jgi:hypothetical protein
LVEHAQCERRSVNHERSYDRSALQFAPARVTVKSLAHASVH